MTKQFLQQQEVLPNYGTDYNKLIINKISDNNYLVPTQSELNLFYRNSSLERNHDKVRDSIIPSIQKKQNNFFFHKMFNPNKKILVLDLDETLIHHHKSPVENADFILKFCYNGPKKRSTDIVYILIRPFVSLFLKTMNNFFNLIIYTASNDYVI